MASSYLFDDSESDFTVVIEKVGCFNRTWSNGDNDCQMSDPVLAESDFPADCDDQNFDASSTDALVSLHQGGGHYSRELLNAADPKIRFLLCRSQRCHPSGNYFGHILTWASSFPLGWQFACPICGQGYRPGSIDARLRHIHAFKTSAGILLSHFPVSSQNEMILNFMECLNLPEAQMHSESVHWQDLHMTPRAHFVIHQMNSRIPTRKLKFPFQFDHLLSGFSGAFVNLTPNIHVLDFEQIEDLLSLLKNNPNQEVRGSSEIGHHF